MEAVLSYRDKSNSLTIVKVKVPITMKRMMKIGRVFHIEDFDLTPKWLWRQTGNKYNPDLDHNKVEVINILKEIRIYPFLTKNMILSFLESHRAIAKKILLEECGLNRIYLYQGDKKVRITEKYTNRILPVIEKYGFKIKDYENK